MRIFFHMRRPTYAVIETAECKVLLKTVKKVNIEHLGVELLKTKKNYKTYFLNCYFI